MGKSFLPVTPSAPCFSSVYNRDWLVLLCPAHWKLICNEEECGACFASFLCEQTSLGNLHSPAPPQQSGSVYPKEQFIIYTLHMRRSKTSIIWSPFLWAQKTAWSEGFQHYPTIVNCVSQSILHGIYQPKLFETKILSCNAGNMTGSLWSGSWILKPVSEAGIHKNLGFFFLLQADEEVWLWKFLLQSKYVG